GLDVDVVGRVDAQAARAAAAGHGDVGVLDVGGGVGVDDRDGDAAGPGEQAAAARRRDRRHVLRRGRLHDDAAARLQREAVARVVAAEDAADRGAVAAGLDRRPGLDEGLRVLVEVDDVDRGADAGPHNADADAAGDHVGVGAVLRGYDDVVVRV